MKTSSSPDSKAIKASANRSLSSGSIGVKGSTKRTNRQNHKAKGRGEEFIAGKENQYFLPEVSVRMCPGLPDTDAFLMEKRKTLEIHAGQTSASCAKIKLQLFPINKETRIGLEKDGHNPHLELTLSGQKKISSVLKHLEKKWGSSSIAKGDPMLFPYNITENLSDCIRWTIKDSHTTAAAVYAAVGSPTIFRLKYGWFYIHEPRSFGGTEGGCHPNLETLYDEPDKLDVRSKKYKATDVGDAGKEVAAHKTDNASVEPLDNEPRVSSSFQQPSFAWVDSLTNVSIGGLLSEASLQGRFSTPDPKSFGSNIAMQSSQIISDSLDAFIAAQISCPVSRLSAEDLRTSILDAEETCHAFPLQKLSSPAKDVQTVSRKNSLNSLKFLNPNKVNDPDGLSQNPSSGRTQTDLLLSSRSCDDEQSLGLTGIKWNDSLGPFDLGMPADKLLGGDNGSISGFVK